MINVLIIEDEAPARRKLLRYIEQLNDKVHVIAELSSVTEAINFLKSDEKPDLIFSDIELLDGNAFEIYETLKIDVPIIFTTAYNQFVMDAFETNGIEYLLKPFSFERFEKAWDKFRRLTFKENSSDILQKLNGILSAGLIAPKEFRKRFSVRNAQGIYFLELQDIVFFQAEDGVVMAIDMKGKKHLLSQSTLKEIEEELDPAEFFRLNRSEIIQKSFVDRTERYGKNAIAVKLKTQDKLLISSQSATALFGEWMEK